MRDTVEMRSILSIRAAIQEDLRGIVAVERDSFYAQDRYAKGVLKKLIEQTDDPLNGLSFLVARDPIAGGPAGVAGYAIGKRQEDGTALLSSIAVLPSHRGLGIGWELVNSIAKTLDGRSVSLHVDTFNRTAVRAYERQGFKPGNLVPGYYAPGRDALSMSLRLGG